MEPGDEDFVEAANRFSVAPRLAEIRVQHSDDPPPHPLDEYWSEEGSTSRVTLEQEESNLEHREEEEASSEPIQDPLGSSNHRYSVSRLAEFRVQQYDVPPPPRYENIPEDGLEPGVPLEQETSIGNQRGSASVTIDEDRSPTHNHLTPLEPDCFTITVNFVLDHWKVLLIGFIAVILLLTALILILVLVVLKPKNDGVGTTLDPALATTVDPNAICTSGFTLINNKCWMLTGAFEYRANANNYCLTKQGSTMVSIMNAVENDALAKFVKGEDIDKIWMGLKCEGHDGSSCKWDYGQGPLGAYSNFKAGSPDINIADCVYYSVSSKQWISANCNGSKRNVVCELPTTDYDTCENNYNRNCYFPVDLKMLWDDAIQECKKKYCGTLLTLHSVIENRFVQSIKVNFRSMLLGCVAGSLDFVTCIDHADRLYSRMKSFSVDQNCVIYDYSDGYWYTDSCSKPTAFMCKKPVGVKC